MASFGRFLYGLVFGVLLGMWVGVNIGKDKPLFSNPFAETEVSERLKETGQQILDKGSEALQRGTDALRDQDKQ